MLTPAGIWGVTPASPGWSLPLHSGHGGVLWPTSLGHVGALFCAHRSLVLEAQGRKPRFLWLVKLVSPASLPVPGEHRMAAGSLISETEPPALPTHLLDVSGC